MDITHELVELARLARETREEKNDGVVILSTVPAHRSPSPPSPVIIRAAEVLSQLHAFDDMISKIYDRYVGFHSPLGNLEASTLSSAARVQLDHELTRFLAEAGSSLRDMRFLINSEIRSAGIHGGYGTAESRAHYAKICVYLSSDLADLTKRVQCMRREQAALDSDSTAAAGPFSFYGGSANGSNSGSDNRGVVTRSNEVKEWIVNENDSLNPGAADEAGTAAAKALSAHGSGEEESRSTAASKGIGKDSLNADFVRRFECQIAKPETLRQYDTLAAQHKKSLLKESHMLHDRYSEELQQAADMERSVNQVSSLLANFAAILSSQSEIVTTVHEEAKVATGAVQASVTELQTTAERSESHGAHLAYLGFGLGLFLLLLDFITP